MTRRVPLVGVRTDTSTESLTGRSMRGLVIKSSDCEQFAPPRHVNLKLAEIQDEIDRRKVRHGMTHGYIEHDGEQVTDWDVDDRLLK